MVEVNSIIQGDCLQIMSQIPDGSIDLIVTDPPYKLTQRGSSGTMSGYWTTDAAKKGTVFEHNDIEIEQYLPEFYRILKEDAHCYIMCNNLNMPHFFDVIGKSKFHFVKLLVWDKQTKICGKYYMGQIEFIFFLRKGKDKPINDCGVSDLFSFPNKKEKNADGLNIHDSQKPVGLMQTLIRNSSNEGDIVLEPFCGSGTTCIAALRENRKYIGIELDPKYYEVAKKRIETELSQLKLFDYEKQEINRDTQTF